MNKNASTANDDREIDLATISRNINNAFNWINRSIFLTIRFFLRNIIIVLILIVLGVALGVYLDKTQRVYDHQIIVKPNFGSVDYLYKKIDLIDSKIRERDTAFLHLVGIEEPDKLLRIEIRPLVDVYQFVSSSEQNFEMLKLMSDDGDVKKVVEDPVTSKNYTFHAISFTTKKMTSRENTVEPLMKFLNDSKYYSLIQKEYINNEKLKMAENDRTISQINGVLDQFARTTSESGRSGNLVYYNENTQLNDVIKTKDELTKEQGEHRLELANVDKIIKETSVIINIENRASVNGKLKLVLPLLFLFLFIFGYAFRRYYKKQSQLLAAEK
ncbi:MAG: hypothetical protein EOO51_10630 [Flavobacterium sp.]|nr:MAG: hypothetical protein EOO51_10630 [Flavobacterium sp.]